MPRGMFSPEVVLETYFGDQHLLYLVQSWLRNKRVPCKRGLRYERVDIGGNGLDPL